MRILYDSAAFLEPFGGVSRYFTEVVKRLPSDVCGEIAAVGTDNEYLQAAPFNVPPPQCSLRSFWPWFRFRGKLYVYRFVSWLLPRLYPSVERENERLFLKKLKDCDLVHLTAPHRYEGLWKKCVGKKPIVITVHDLIPDMFWRDPRYKLVRARVLEAVDHVIAVSQHTKNDLMRLYGIAEDKISVVYHGYTEPQGQDMTPVFPGMRYILFVGRRGEYKNFNFFFQAIAPLLKGDRTLNLVCTGPGFSLAEREMFASAGVVGQVHHKFIPDRSMLSVFKHAQCFVYPSKYEGFGMPILDAFAAGCPVVLSNCSCFPEVAGDAALYFEDGNADGLRSAVEHVLKDGNKRDLFIERGKRRLSIFSWGRCANETAAVYEKAMHNK